MDISVKVTGLDQLTRRLREIGKGIESVVQPAINKVADKARAEINRAIPEEYAVRASEVRNAVDIRRAARGDMRAVISIFGSARKRGRSLNMIHFLAAIQAGGAARKTRGSRATKVEMQAIAKQLGFRIRRDGGLKSIKGAFLGNRGRTIFRRKGDARLPIEPVQVIGFSQMFSSRKIHERVLSKIRDDLPIEIDRALARLLKSGA